MRAAAHGGMPLIMGRIPMKIETIRVGESRKKMTFDPAGFFTVLVDREEGALVVEHCSNVEKGTGREVDTGRLDRVFTGASAEALCHAIVDSGLVTRLDHAAYLGRELARAEAALRSGSDYEQDEGDG